MANNYIDICDSLRKTIQDGRIRAGSRVGPLKKLCSEYDASLMTVDRALRELEKEGVLERKHQRGFFVAEQADRFKGLISVIIGSMTSEATIPDLIDGVEGIASDRGYHVSFACTRNSISKAMQAAEFAAGAKSRGVIYEPVSGRDQFAENAKVIKYLQDRNIPVVIAGHCELDDVGPLPSVSSAHRRAGEEMTEYLLGLGYQSISVLGVGACQDQYEIVKGCENAFAANGCAVEGLQISLLSFKQSIEVQVKQMMHQANPPEAIFAIPSGVAGPVLQALNEMGLRVPDDVAVVGFGDSPLAKSFSVPMTVMHIKHNEEGQLLGGLLIDILEGRQVENDHIELACDLVIRRSCGVRSVKRGLERRVNPLMATRS